MTQHDTDMTHPPRVTVEDAAQLFGVSVDAVRKRIERGTLQSERVGKTRYVLLDEAAISGHDTARTRDDSDMTPLIEELRFHNAYLREQLDKEREANRENRRLLAAALERIPALEEATTEPATQPRESHVTGSHVGASTEVPDEGPEREKETSEERGGNEVLPEQQERTSWWQRWFGGR